MMKVRLSSIILIFIILIPFSVKSEEGINIIITQEWLDLLHYEKGKSVVDKNSAFFISPVGHKDSKAEFFAALKVFEEENTEYLCRFPARAEYISKTTGKVFIKPKCPDYEEFKQRVPMDKAYIVFASENNTIPASVMGHIFVKFSGIYEGKLREHAFSYFAADIKSDNFKFYYDVLVSSIDGTYALTPYHKKIKDYLENEQRPVWELELDLTDEQKSYLHKHLWELKGQNVRYSFINHNCGTGTINIIKIIKPEILDNKIYKLFETPIDYIKMANNSGSIKSVSVTPSEEYRLKSKNGRNKNILDAKNSSQIYIGHRNFNHSRTEINYMPVYQDFFDVSKAYYDDIETKIMNINLAYDNNLYVDKIDLLKMRSIVDASQSLKLTSKHIKFSLENALYRRSTSIKPVTEAGIGYAYGIFEQIIKPYILPKLGYRYDTTNNFYFTPELGIILKPIDDVKIVLYYEKYFDTRYNNRGFNEKISTNFAYLLFDKTTLYIKYNKYSGTLKGDEEFLAGIGYNF